MYVLGISGRSVGRRMLEKVMLSRSIDATQK